MKTTERWKGQEQIENICAKWVPAAKDLRLEVVRGGALYTVKLILSLETPTRS
jgi:hypothetical protein